VKLAVKTEATVIEELPSLVYRLELANQAKVLAHGLERRSGIGSGCCRATG